MIRDALVIFAEVVKVLLEADDFNVHVEFRKNPHANRECDIFCSYNFERPEDHPARGFSGTL